MLFPPIAWDMLSQFKPDADIWQASLPPTMMLPAKAITRPTPTILRNRSFRKMGDNKATHNGDVVTSTAELGTDVYFNDEIQVAK